MSGKEAQVAKADRTDLVAAPRGVVLKKLYPSAAGTKRLAALFGKALVCVRYREDAAGRRRLTTVELIIDERPLPTPVLVRIAYEEMEVCQRVKAAGGTWDARLEPWRVPRAAVRDLKLEQRVVPDNA